VARADADYTRRVNPVTDPPRLLVRFLDDVHMIAVANMKIADAVARIPEFEERLRVQLEGLDSAIGAVVRLGEDTRSTLSQLEVMKVAVEQLNASTAVLVSAVEPLQGIAERMGRVVGRIPDALRSAGSGGSGAR
jgi:ABC-type transporter Mla subunit MlaD